MSAFPPIAVTGAPGTLTGMRRLASLLTLVVISGCSDTDATKGQAQPATHHAEESGIQTAVVTGFGGPGSRRGWVDVHLRSGSLSGVIANVRSDELDCRIGDRVPVKQSGQAIVALKGVCRKGGAVS